MSQIWIVEGSTGEYSDHQEWHVKAFRDEVKAQRLVVEAQARANEIFPNRHDDGWYDEPRPARLVNEFDPYMRLDYTGTHYTCCPIELVEE